MLLLGSLEANLDRFHAIRIHCMQTFVQNIICSFNALMYVIMRCYLVEAIFYSVSRGENINILPNSVSSFIPTYQTNFHLLLNP